MFAVIRTGGKQYKVAKNDIITVERLAGEPSDTVELSDVLMIGGEGAEPVVGAPLVEGAGVSAEIVAQPRADKVTVFKKKRRQNYRRKRGHRQLQTALKIMDIKAKGKSGGAKTTARKPAKAEEATAEAAAGESKDAKEA